jgi:hypothetical protein
MEGRNQGLVTLPSGRRLHVARAAEATEAVSDDRRPAGRTFGGRLLNAMEREVLQVREGDRPLTPDDLLDWPLSDFHALHDVGERLGAVRAEHVEYDCRNCAARLDPDPHGVLTLEDLESWYAEGVPPPAPPFPLPVPVRLRKGREAQTFEMRPVSVREAMPLWRATGSERPLRLDATAVRSLGLEALGDERDRAAMARALDGAEDAAWDVIEAAFVELNYAERSFVPHVCPECGTVHDIPAPSLREMWPPPEAFRFLHAEVPLEDAGGEAAREFPTEETFDDMVERVGAEVYAARGVRHIALHCDLGVPPVDGSGEPLLGSYQPLYASDAGGYTDVSFEIRIYYRTFRNMWEQEGPYDVEAEVHDTIDHEVEHHLHHLAGHDPMDEAEREEARRELERTFGTRAVRRAERDFLLGELRRIGILFLVLAVVFGVMVAALHALGLLQD